jgi:hypothetical protein
MPPLSYDSWRGYFSKWRLVSMSDKSLNEKVEWAAHWTEDGFLLLAKRLREVQDKTPELFASVAGLCGIGLRKAFYLARIDRQFRTLGVDGNRLYAIGWSKLRLIGDCINGVNREQLLKLAETCTARELELKMRNVEPVDGTQCVNLYFEPAEYEVFAATILNHGGLKSGRGLTGQEKALIKALSSIKI